MCVHRDEGSWRDPNGPFYGGLQMDLSFQRTYGNWMLRHHGTVRPCIPWWSSSEQPESRGQWF
jgi:hypothetical protein